MRARHDRARRVRRRPQVALVGPIDGEWWRVATSPFFADNLWYAAACMVTIAVFGTLLEQRHGHVVVVLVFCAAGMGGIAVAAALETIPLALGANGAALGLHRCVGRAPRARDAPR